MVSVSLLLALLTALSLPRLWPPAWRLAGPQLSQDAKSGIVPWTRLVTARGAKSRAWPAWLGGGPGQRRWGLIPAGGLAAAQRRLFRADSQDLAPPF